MAADDTIDISPAGLALSVAGIGAMIVSVFLPVWDVGSVNFVRLTGNSLIQNGDGLFFLAFALVSAASVFRAYKTRTAGWAEVISGFLALMFAIWLGAIDREGRTLCPQGDFPVGECEVAAPGIGVYVAGVAALLMVAGGWYLRSGSIAARTAKGGELVPDELKACPDCTERVRVDANRCRYCGFRFPRCPDCAEFVDPSDASCPHCGFDLRSGIAAQPFNPNP